MEGGRGGRKEKGRMRERKRDRKRGRRSGCDDSEWLKDTEGRGDRMTKRETQVAASTITHCNCSPYLIFHIISLSDSVSSAKGSCSMSLRNASTSLGWK